ncbi:hypothetical protein DVH24_013530 [Malus domestica]|uniref:Uncharacterized protein n=1 Tax=Malus domestica TaxID=3750 RepID=A0A498HKD7_MALDO|nr:hypothetical protein DVH24_013530 [Malus domestica]
MRFRKTIRMHLRRSSRSNFSLVMPDETILWFPSSQHLLDEILDLEAEQEEGDFEGNPTTDALGESSATFKGKDVPKKD